MINGDLSTVLLLANCWIASVSSLVTRVPFLPNQRGVKDNHVASSRLNLLVNELDLGGAPSTEKQTELWLDLRGTAVHPRVAVDYIMEELDDNQEPDLIDKVLLSDEHFQKLLEALDPYTQIEEILYVPAETENLVALSRNGVSFPFGSLTGVPRDTSVAVADPIKALQGISKGNWILLVSENDKSETIQQLEAMGSFLEVASTASSSLGATTELESGLLVQAEESSDDSDTECGGVAIKCTSRASVLQLASIFKNTSSGAVTKTTESGILIQEDTPGKSSPFLPTAMILPFDLGLWEAASLIYGHAQYLIDDEVE
jgi:hypothetical protein